MVPSVGFRIRWCKEVVDISFAEGGGKLVLFFTSEARTGSGPVFCPREGCELGPTTDWKNCDGCFRLQAKLSIRRRM